MRICYLVLAHHKFRQATRLIRRLAQGDSCFVLHVDARADQSQAQAFRTDLRALGAKFVPPISAQWGSYRQSLAIMRCMETALSLGPCDRYCLLSGQDYPVASLQKIQNFFKDHPDEEFLEALPLDLSEEGAEGWSPFYRFRRCHIWIGRRHLEVPLIRRGPPPLPIYHGSTWWALTGAAIEHLIRQFRDNDRLRRYLRTGFLVDEAYVPTLMQNSPFASRVTGSNVTYARWEPDSGPHPTVLTLKDLDVLLGAEKLFARKFDSDVDDAVLGYLDTVHDAGGGPAEWERMRTREPRADAAI